MQKEFLETPEASDYLSNVVGTPVSHKTLGKYACLGGGPTYYKFGRKRLYTPDDLREWATSKLSGPLSSTSCEEATSKPSEPMNSTSCEEAA